MKTCPRCGETKEDEQFSWKNRRLGRKQRLCNDCKKKETHEYYERNKERIRGNIMANTAKNKEAAQRFIYEYLSYKVCVDCGEYDFTVLTFDHVRGKKFMDISQMVNQGYSIAAIQREIELCEVVCHNCHQRREHLRRSGGRFRKFWPKNPGEE